MDHCYSIQSSSLWNIYRTASIQHFSPRSQVTEICAILLLHITTAICVKNYQYIIATKWPITHTRGGWHSPKHMPWWIPINIPHFTNTFATQRWHFY